MAEKSQKICLNMIVKNESAVIERCLKSLKHLIDYWVIFDTGSCDGTQSIIRNCLQDIPGELHESRWINFEYNRNEALQVAKKKGDYLLFIDADEILQFDEGFQLPVLNLDSYTFTIRQINAADCKRTSLVKSSLDWKWEGVIHEHLKSSQAKHFGHLEGVLNLCNTSIGARSKNPNKELDDAFFIEKALKKDPHNSRLQYYLGQCYLAAGALDQAIGSLNKRIEMPSSDLQETYLAMYQLGVAHEKKGNEKTACEIFQKAYHFRPSRAEPLYRMAVLHRKKGNVLLGYLLSKFALEIAYPKEDVCVEYMTYEYGIMIEFANCALLLGKYEEGLKACQTLLKNSMLPQDLRAQVLSNLILAKEKTS